jgi:hypothetical protein
VVDACPAPLLEAGPPIEDWGAPASVAVLVQWSATAQVSRSVSQTLHEYTAAGYHVAVCSTAECDTPLEWPHGLPANVAVYRRPNIGYDFGTWSAMLVGWPQLARAERVILANDSLVGPFATIAPILTDFASADCDVWGLIGTNQDGEHLQSHCVGYRDGALEHPALQGFWHGIRLQRSKLALIRKYEIGLAPVLRGAGLRVAAGYPWDLVVQPRQNPTIFGWRRLLQWGFPWVKRELVLRPHPQVPDAPDVRRVVLDRYGQDVLAWI